MGETVNKDISKNLSGKYSQQNFDLTKQFAADTLNTTLKKKSDKNVIWFTSEQFPNRRINRNTLRKIIISTKKTKI